MTAVGEGRAGDRDPDFEPGYAFGGIPPQAKVRLPDGVKKLRKRMRGDRNDEEN